MKRYLILALFTALPIAATQANEQTQAQVVCQRVEVLRAQEQAQEPNYVNCQQIHHPLSYWRCVEAQITGGNSWVYAMGVCGDQSPSIP